MQTADDSQTQQHVPPTRMASFSSLAHHSAETDLHAIVFINSFLSAQCRCADTCTSFSQTNAHLFRFSFLFFFFFFFYFILSFVVRYVHGNHKAYLGTGEWRWGKRGVIYLSRHCYHVNDSCITMGSEEPFYGFADCEGQSHKTVSTNHNLFEQKREPKRNRAEALLLTSLTPYR